MISASVLTIVALVMVAGGLAIGLAGTGLRLATGRTGGVHLGAQMILAIERLPFRFTRGPATYLYLIQDEQAATKIGISGDPRQRVATLQTGHPEPLRLVRSIRCRSAADARAVEGDLHHYFERNRMNGEWFDLDDRQIRRAIRLARRWR